MLNVYLMLGGDEVRVCEFKIDTCVTNVSFIAIVFYSKLH